MRGKVLIVLVAVFLGACAPGALEQRPAAEGTTASGETVFSFTLTRANAFGITPVSERAIAARSRALCPGGWREISRYGQAERRISGIIYTDVTVRIVCT